MRIVGGEWRGRRLVAPTGSATRPTADRVREAVASALLARRPVDGLRVLELFAGSGAFAFEMLSRGAAFALLVDNHAAALRCARQNAETLQALQRVELVAADLLVRPQAFAKLLVARHMEGFDLVFADAPYAAIEAVPPLLQSLAEHGLLQPDCLLAVEHATKQPPSSWGSLQPLKLYRHGHAAVQLLALPDADSASR